MDIKYPIENKYMKCVLQINGFSGPHPQVWSNRWVGLGRVKGGGGVWGCDSASILKLEVLNGILDIDSIL